jgi:hypothetical protein
VSKKLSRSRIVLIILAVVMNRVGVHTLVWVGGWSEAECRRAIENSRAAGYDLEESN